ncbi:Aste57867_3387 [Aphanomyces stellatus]|uniref:Aste57867_3387 protein n=1 Tax=Aphanomyces stellatus TaxID=120398 RepID=A0A485KF16_9STRA|nr:hypothetical protein As57867_003377 [Aphanomyces stellatus]VFT80553.1 Aste57867_3387 [Aphanomyces stellatus]
MKTSGASAALVAALAAAAVVGNIANDVNVAPLHNLPTTTAPVEAGHASNIGRAGPTNTGAITTTSIPGTTSPANDNATPTTTASITTRATPATTIAGIAQTTTTAAPGKNNTNGQTTTAPPSAWNASTTTSPSSNSSSSNTTVSPSINGSSTGAVQCPFVFTSALVTTQFNAILDEFTKKNASSSGNTTDGSNGGVTPITTAPTSGNTSNTVVPPGTSTTTTAPSGGNATKPNGTSTATTTAPPSTGGTTTATPTTTSTTGTTTGVPSTTTLRPVGTTTTASPTTTGKTTLRPGATTTAPPSTDDRRRRLGTTSDVAFTCDASFYQKWISSGLKCNGQDLNVAVAVQHAACATYHGNVPLSGISIESCLTTCYFPSCVNGAWDYSTDKTMPGFGSAVYANFDFSQWFSSSMNDQLKQRTENIVNFKNFSMVVDATCTSSGACWCPAYQAPSSGALSNIATRIEAVKKQQQQAADYAPVTKWVPSTPMESAMSYTASITQYATYVGVAASTSAVAVTSIASTAAVGSTGAAASAAGSAASVSVAVGLLDLASFVTNLAQINLPRAPPALTSVASSLGGFQFNFVKWDDARYVPPPSAPLVGTTKRSLAAQDNSMNGMERYAATVGVKPNMLFYVTLVGLCVAAAVVGVLLGLVLLGAKVFSKDYATFQTEAVDRTVGALLLLAIVGQYAVGVTGTFEITRSMDKGQGFGASVFVAIAALLFLSIGTIVYGYFVVRNHEQEIVDNGTKDHFDKAVHKRYGCLYDEYNYDNRFFFVVKMLLALLAGMTTGMSNLSGFTQVIILIGLHIAFVLYMELRQPHIARFVQQATTLITVIKIASLVLTALLFSAIVGLPEGARTAIGYVILSLQGLVVLFMVARQGFIFYRQWKLKKQPDDDQDRRMSVAEFYGQTNVTSTDAVDKVGGDSRKSIDVEHANARRLPPLNHHPGKEYTF